MSEVETKVMSASEKKKEDWMNSKWRPMMGWMYMLVCTTDFVLFPILWSLIQAAHGGNVTTQWQPITLAGAGLFHIAMGAVLGIAAFGRTQEKMNGANNNNAGFGSSPGGFGSSPGGFGSAPGGFGQSPMSNGFGNVPLGGNSMSTGGFGQSNNGFNAGPAPTFMSSSGKPGPAQPQFPAI